MINDASWQAIRSQRICKIFLKDYCPDYLPERVLVLAYHSHLAFVSFLLANGPPVALTYTMPGSNKQTSAHIAQTVMLKP